MAKTPTERLCSEMELVIATGPPLRHRRERGSARLPARAPLAGHRQVAARDL